MSYWSNIRIIPSHEDIFGIKGKSEKQIIDEIQEFNNIAILHLCSKLMLFLSSDRALQLEKQVKVAQGLLNEDARLRLRDFIVYKDNDAQMIFFHYTPVLMMIKLNLEHNDETGRDINIEDDSREKFVSLLISLSDIWLKTERLTKVGNKKSSDKFIEEFRIFQAKQTLQLNESEPMLNLMARGRYLLNIVRTDKRLDVDAIFKASTGLELDTYMNILLMVMTNWTINVEFEKLEQITVRDTEQFFKNMKINKRDIEKFLSIVGLTINEYPNYHEEMLQRVGMQNNDTLTNFITFMSKPILLYENRFLCLSPNFLLLQLTEGPYNILRESLKGTRDADILPVVWGDGYESYAVERLSSAFKGRVYADIKDINNAQALDALIDLDDVCLLVEIKYPHWSFKARHTGSRQDMQGFLDKIARYKPKKEQLGKPKVDKKKGLGQIKQFTEKLNRGDVKLPISLEGKAFIPVLVLGEEFPFDPVNRQYLERYAASEGCLINDNRTLPFILLNSEEIELIESLAEEVGFEQAKKTLITYSVKFHPEKRKSGFLHQPTSFKNEIYNSETRVKNNKFLQEQIDLSFKPLLKMLSKPKSHNPVAGGLE